VPHRDRSALGDNKLSELGHWNLEMLRLELKELTADVPNLEFDYSLTGFDSGEVDQILGAKTSSSRQRRPVCTDSSERA
jgi:hypothetical protein